MRANLNIAHKDKPITVYGKTIGEWRLVEKERDELREKYITTVDKYDAAVDEVVKLRDRLKAAEGVIHLAQRYKEHGRSSTKFELFDALTKHDNH